MSSMLATSRVALTAALCFAILGLWSCGSSVPEAECLSSGDCAAEEVCVALSCVPASSLSPCGPPPAGVQAGAACGDCNNGVWSCGPSGWTCFGESTNACGGCAAAPGAVGDGCGFCGGQWTCEGDSYVCDDARNLCGGCATLEPAEAVLGRACETAGAEEGNDGVWLCSSPNALQCVSVLSNSCGGQAALDGVPGEPCGPCAQGRLTCDGADELSCCYGEACGAENAVADACGGCGAMPDQLGEPCGACGTGTWQLDCNVGALVCRGDTRNGCGGCAALAATPGEDCGVGASIACLGPETVGCIADNVVNSCGGSQPLNGAPGDPCGACGTGLQVCSSPNTLGCIGEVQTNACGGCTALRDPPGALCAAGGSLVCADSATLSEPPLVCATPAGRDACGGASDAPQTPFEVCGACDGRWACDEETLACIVDETRRPRTMYIDGDRDGFGDRRDEGSSQCGGAEGYAETATDCDDTRREVNPEATEVPANALDDDCNPATLD